MIVDKIGKYWTRDGSVTVVTRLRDMTDLHLGIATGSLHNQEYVYHRDGQLWYAIQSKEDLIEYIGPLEKNIKIDKLGFYKTRSGELVEVVDIDVSDVNTVLGYLNNSHWSWYLDGKVTRARNTDEDLIEYLGTIRPSTGVLVKQTFTPEKTKQQEIQTVKSLVDQLMPLLDNNAVKVDRWLKSPQPGWNGLTPLDLISAGKIAAVFNMIKTEDDGEVVGS